MCVCVCVCVQGSISGEELEEVIENLKSKAPKPQKNRNLLSKIAEVRERGITLQGGTPNIIFLIEVEKRALRFFFFALPLQFKVQWKLLDLRKSKQGNVPNLSISFPMKERAAQMRFKCTRNNFILHQARQYN